VIVLLDAERGPLEVLRGVHETSWDDAVGKDFAGAVDVVEEGLKHAHALDHPGFKTLPLFGVNEPGNRIERKRHLLAGVREGDTAVTKRAITLDASLLKLRSRQRPKSLVKPCRLRTRDIEHLEHFVPRVREGVAVKEVAVHALMFSREPIAGVFRAREVALWPSQIEQLRRNEGYLLCSARRGNRATQRDFLTSPRTSVRARAGGTGLH
jgi:hypothetical protein